MFLFTSYVFVSLVLISMMNRVYFTGGDPRGLVSSLQWFLVLSPPGGCFHLSSVSVLLMCYFCQGDRECWCGKCSSLLLFADYVFVSLVFIAMMNRVYFAGGDPRGLVSSL